MQYMLLIHSEEGAFERLPNDVVVNAMAEYGAYTEALRKASVLVNSNRLRPSSMSSTCLLYTSPSPRDRQKSRMPSSA